MNRLLPILLRVTITTLAGCESPAPWPTSGVFVGYYAFGFERSDFKPAGTAERWWLGGNISSLKQEKGVTQPMSSLAGH